MVSPLVIFLLFATFFSSTSTSNTRDDFEIPIHIENVPEKFTILPSLMVTNRDKSAYSTSAMENYSDRFDSLVKPLPILTVDVNKTIDLAKYLNNTELENLLIELGKKYRDIVKVVKIGESAFHYTPIWAVEITKNVQQPRERLKPMFKFVANVHGDETVGYALMVSLIQYLVYKYGDKQDQSVKKILEEIDVWIIPTLNPDGLQVAIEGDCEGSPIGYGRTNAYGRDIDEDFKKFKRVIESESLPMRAFFRRSKHPFVLSGNLQGGEIDVSSPPIVKSIAASHRFDSSGPEDLEPNMIQDSSFFDELGSEYSSRNSMFSGKPKCKKGNHRNKKGLSDFNYIHTNCFELNLELSCCKSPLARDLPYYWTANLDAMLNFIKSTRRGVYGLVLDRRGRPVKDAVIRVRGMEKNISVSEDGEFWRLLLPGLYEISAMAPCYETRSHEKRVLPNETYVRQDFILTRIQDLFVMQHRAECVRLLLGLSSEKENVRVRTVKDGHQELGQKMAERVIELYPVLN